MAHRKKKTKQNETKSEQNEKWTLLCETHIVKNLLIEMIMFCFNIGKTSNEENRRFENWHHCYTI